MQIWNYHPATSELLGANEAWPHPLEEGAFLQPAFSTTVAPGAPQPGYVYQFTGSSWQSVVDCRGQVWWKADAKDNTQPVVVDFIGEPSLRGLTNVEPPAPVVIPEPTVASAHQLFAALASALGKTPAEIEALAELAKTL